MGDSLQDLGEFGLISTLTAGLKQGEQVRQGIGDDCAILEVGDRQVLLTCDASLEDVHFKRHWGRPEDIGWKAAVSALSDIAAMGGRATAVLVTLALPMDVPLAYVEGLYRGVTDAVESAGATIVGGDTTRSPFGIVLDFSVVGEVVGRPLLRSGAEVGDLIAMTGMVGERGAGLHALLNDIDAPEFIRAYLHPVPRLEAGQWLQARSAVHAMMDVSDGLLPDVRHIALASGVDIELASYDLPESPALEAYWEASGLNSAQQRLRSGEEYELLLCIAPGAATALVAEFQQVFGLPLTIVGRCCAGTGEVRVDGACPDSGGFEHFQAPSDGQ